MTQSENPVFTTQRGVYNFVGPHPDMAKLIDLKGGIEGVKWRIFSKISLGGIAGGITQFSKKKPFLPKFNVNLTKLSLNLVKLS